MEAIRLPICKDVRGVISHLYACVCAPVYDLLMHVNHQYWYSSDSSEHVSDEFMLLFKAQGLISRKVLTRYTAHVPSYKYSIDSQDEKQIHVRTDERDDRIVLIWRVDMLHHATSSFTSELIFADDVLVQLEWKMLKN